jgi:D-alanyl-lipoteichoic acid acyltransferase DltB (MBOAT superfamily)
MNFAEARFWVLLFLGLGIILLVRSLLRRTSETACTRFDKVGLAGLGLVLLLAVNWLTCVIFVVVAITSFVGLAWIVKWHPRRARLYLVVLVPLQMLPLAYYKYSEFLLNETFNLGIEAIDGLLIPAGISFYTFQMVSFVVDTLAFRKPMPHFLDFLNFAGFFPQIVAGPIERREDLLPQVQEFQFRWLPSDVNAGCTYIALGLFFKCCLADNFANYFNGASTTNAFSIWLDNLVFGLRIYYDFAGYSLVAIGLAQCFGLRLTLNFQSPYCSRNLMEFWRRWHITLSQWFRDYVYLPLGGNRTRFWAINILIVFLVSGVWHGAGWNFVIWGAFHGAFLVIARVVGPKLNVPRPLAWAMTFVGVMAAWLCFYETRSGLLFPKMWTLLRPSAYGGDALVEAFGRFSPSDLISLGSFFALSCLVLLFEWLSLTLKNEPYFFLRRPKAVFCLLLLTIWLSPLSNNAFIYFAF